MRRGAGAEKHNNTTQHSTAAPWEGLRRTTAMAVSSREKTSQRSTWPVQSLALETHWRASAVLSIASSATGTKRTRTAARPHCPRHGRRIIPFLLSSPSSAAVVKTDERLISRTRSGGDIHHAICFAGCSSKGGWWGRPLDLLPHQRGGRNLAT
jgi:hypothetical protein